MNKSESERLATILDSIGYEETDSIESADFLMINTCSIKESAENRVYSLLHKTKQIKKEKPHFTVGITGCMIAMHQKKLQKLTDVCFNIKDMDQLPDLINGLCRPNHNSMNNFVDYLEIRPKRKSKAHTFVPIMSGCDNFCSFCVVPYTRGREISRSSKEIVSEIEELVSKGYKAITLLGQNVNSYGKNSPENINFVDLLKKVCAIEGDFWVWFTSSHPKDMSDELIDFMAKEPKMANYIHFAIQSGSDRILKAMNRHYTYDHCVALTKKIQEKIPGVMISTDIIVGFPGETDEDFEATKKICKEIGFEMVYLGRYSPRPNTRAFHMKETADSHVKRKRDHEVMEVIEENNIKKNKTYVGKTVRVLVDKQVLAQNVKESDTEFFGKTETFKTVRFTSKKPVTTGDFVDVNITESLNWGLKGVRK